MIRVLHSHIYKQLLCTRTFNKKIFLAKSSITTFVFARAVSAFHTQCKTFGAIEGVYFLSAWCYVLVGLKRQVSTSSQIHKYWFGTHLHLQAPICLYRFFRRWQRCILWKFIPNRTRHKSLYIWMANGGVVFFKVVNTSPQWEGHVLFDVHAFNKEAFLLPEKWRKSLFTRRVTACRASRCWEKRLYFARR